MYSRHKGLTITFLAALGLAAFASTVDAQQLQQGELAQLSDELQFVPGEILIKFASGVSESVINETIAEMNCTLIDECFGGFLRLGLPEGKELETAELAGADPNCEWSAPNLLVYGSDLDDLGEEPPDDPFFPLCG